MKEEMAKTKGCREAKFKGGGRIGVIKGDRVITDRQIKGELMGDRGHDGQGGNGDAEIGDRVVGRLVWEEGWNPDLHPPTPSWKGPQRAGSDPKACWGTLAARAWTERAEAEGWKPSWLQAALLYPPPGGAPAARGDLQELRVRSSRRGSGGLRAKGRGEV